MPAFYFSFKYFNQISLLSSNCIKWPNHHLHLVVMISSWILLHCWIPKQIAYQKLTIALIMRWWGFIYNWMLNMMQIIRLYVSYKCKIETMVALVRSKLLTNMTMFMKVHTYIIVILLQFTIVVYGLSPPHRFSCICSCIMIPSSSFKL